MGTLQPLLLPQKAESKLWARRLEKVREWRRLLQSGEKNVLMREIWRLDMEWAIKELRKAGYDEVV